MAVFYSAYFLASSLYSLVVLAPPIAKPREQINRVIYVCFGKNVLSGTSICLVWSSNLKTRARLVADTCLYSRHDARPTNLSSIASTGTALAAVMSAGDICLLNDGQRTHAMVSNDLSTKTGAYAAIPCKRLVWAALVFEFGKNSKSVVSWSNDTVNWSRLLPSNVAATQANTM